MSNQNQTTGIMDYEEIKSQLKQINARLNANNFREIKQELIQLQNQASSLELVSMQRSELREIMQALFERIKEFQEKDQEQFQQEAAENFEFLKDQLVDVIEFTEANLENHDMVWQKLLQVQQHFKGKRLIQEQREQLYNTLQKLFELAKKRKEESLRKRDKASSMQMDKLDDAVDIVVSQCETADIEKAWAMLLETKDRVSNSQLTPPHRKKLLDKLQDGFEIVKLRREDRQKAFMKEAVVSEKVIASMLDEATDALENNPVFKEKWDLLMAIQQEFRQRKLEKSAREKLYNKLQLLFHRLKNEQGRDQEDFEKQADENVKFLKPLVDQSMDLANNSLEFRKAKGFLIKVQSEFKGKKMRGVEREKLYSRLQSAFDVLQKRLDEYIASRKEVREFRVDGRLSDVEMKIDQLENSIETDQEKLGLLQSALQDSRAVESAGKKGDDLENQVQIMKAAIQRKQNELEELVAEREKLHENKQRLDELGQEQDE